jgi:hypothetical protein
VASWRAIWVGVDWWPGRRVREVLGTGRFRIDPAAEPRAPRCPRQRSGDGAVFAFDPPWGPPSGVGVRGN